MSRASAHTLSASQIYVCTKWNQHHLCLSIVSVLMCVRMLFPSHPLLLLLAFFFVIILSSAAAAAAAAPSSAFCFRLMPCIAFCIYRKHQWTVVRISFHAEQAQRVESYHQITHSLFLLVYLSLSISVYRFFSFSYTPKTLAPIISLIFAGKADRSWLYNQMKNSSRQKNVTEKNSRRRRRIAQKISETYAFGKDWVHVFKNCRNCTSKCWTSHRFDTVTQLSSCEMSIEWKQRIRSGVCRIANSRAYRCATNIRAVKTKW